MNKILNDFIEKIHSILTKEGDISNREILNLAAEALLLLVNERAVWGLRMDKCHSINTDYEFFKTKLLGLLRKERGRFALIKNREIHGTYLSVEDALKHGYEKFGNTDFLIQEITDEIRVNYII